MIVTSLEMAIHDVKTNDITYLYDLICTLINDSNNNGSHLHEILLPFPAWAYLKVPLLLSLLALVRKAAAAALPQNVYVRIHTYSYV